MVRILRVLGLVWMASVAPVWAATIEEPLLSVDAEGRTITLQSGAILNLTAHVVTDGLQPGQLVRVTYTDDTIDATAVDILEPAPATDSARNNAAEPTVGGDSQAADQGLEQESGSTADTSTQDQ